MAWTLYELFNEARREVFVGVTEKDVGAEFELNSAMPPAAIRHWDFRGERIRCSARQAGLTKHEAREAARGYQAGDGWVLKRGI